MDISLDDYIAQKGISKPNVNSNKNAGVDECDFGSSKFNRYNKEDEVYDDEDMPQLKPIIKNENNQTKKPIHERLGDRGSVYESVHTSQMNLFKPQKKRQQKSVHNRLNKAFINPAVATRNKIAVNALTSFATNAAKLLTDPTASCYDDFFGVFNQVNQINNSGPGPSDQQKYNMRIQKEISQIQGKDLLFKGPETVVSSDGKGIEGFGRVPQNTTSISLHQRFT